MWQRRGGGHVSHIFYLGSSHRNRPSRTPRGFDFSARLQRTACAVSVSHVYSIPIALFAKMHDTYRMPRYICIIK